MSYCRFSSDDFRCDLYIYQDVRGGWTTHVAGSKVVGYIPRVGRFPNVKIWDNQTLRERVLVGIWQLRNRLQGWYLEHAPRRDLSGPHAGDDFNDSTLKELRERVVALRSAGYRCPGYVLERIDAEIAEDA